MPRSPISLNQLQRQFVLLCDWALLNLPLFISSLTFFLLFKVFLLLFKRKLQRQFHSQQRRIPLATRVSQPYDVFINHRGIDTKQTIASLVYNHLAQLKLRPFLDYKNLKPGDKLLDKINVAIKESKIGVVILSPNYCESYFCLYELSLIMEMKKKVIPIFCDVKPSELRIVNNGSMSEDEFQRFISALEEVKGTIGLTFNSITGNWSDVITSAADCVINKLKEVEGEQF